MIASRTEAGGIEQFIRGSLLFLTRHRQATFAPDSRARCLEQSWIPRRCREFLQEALGRAWPRHPILAFVKDAGRVFGRAFLDAVERLHQVPEPPRVAGGEFEFQYHRVAEDGMGDRKS